LSEFCSFAASSQSSNQRSFCSSCIAVTRGVTVRGSQITFGTNSLSRFFANGIGSRRIQPFERRFPLLTNLSPRRSGNCCKQAITRFDQRILTQRSSHASLSREDLSWITGGRVSCGRATVQGEVGSRHEQRLVHLCGCAPA
jgi:hypothetical protein